MKNGEQPAYPQNFSDSFSYKEEIDTCGLTKREYFASMAMQGLCSNLRIGDKTDGLEHEFSELAILIADELLKRLNE